METVTKETVKFLLIGEERICQQVAYVMSFDNFEIKGFDLLSERNVQEVRNYNIYVCDFKRKWRRQVKKLALNNVKYLDDICREIDRQCLCDRRQSRKEFFKKFKHMSPMKHYKLWGYDWLKSIYYKIKGTKTMRAAKRFKYDCINNVKYLSYLKPSQLFLYVLYAPLNEHVNCSYLESNIFLAISGDVRGCCSTTVPFGNILFDGTLDQICRSTYARIIKLSSLNHSYCLCDFNKWCLCYSSEKVKERANLPVLKTHSDGINCINAEIDSSCNLCCKSCRNKKYVMDDVSRLKADIVVDKLLSSGYLDQTKNLILSGRGEVFYSPYYRRLLETDLKRKNIHILSNGILFNETNWNWLKNKYETIDVQISVDAATKETYQNLRGGNFDVLLKNLHMLAVLHRQGHIRNFKLNFLVQRDNFREMVEFVKLGRSLNADCIEFQRMCNFGNLSKKKLLERCLIINDEYLDLELWQVLQDPIFKDQIVDLRGFERYIHASNKRYMDQN